MEKKVGRNTAKQSVICGQSIRMTAEELLAKYAAGERDFRNADLNGADLNGADLNGADLNGVDLNGADLNGARMPY